MTRAYLINFTPEQEKIFLPLLESMHVEIHAQKPFLPEAPYYPEKSNYTFEDIEAIIKQFPKNYIWKARDLEKYFPQDLKVSVQIIQNQIIIMPSPNYQHQKISMELSSAMHIFSKQNNLGQVVTAPMDVIFDEDNVFQPDIIFVAISRKDIIQEKNINSAPDLLVEIWSPANKSKDQAMKTRIYQEKSVKEYWQIFPKEEKVKVDVLSQSKQYEVYSEAEKTGKVQSKILSGFEIDVEDIFT